MKDPNAPISFEGNEDSVMGLGAPRQEMRRIIGLLSELRRAFYVTGNDHVANTLDLMAADLNACEAEINRLQGRIVSDQLRASSEASSNMLRAALAGVRVAGGN